MPEVKRQQSWDVTRLYGLEAGKDVFVLGTGTSLRGFEYAKLDGRVVIALNDAPLISKRRFAYHLWADSNLSKRYVGIAGGGGERVVCDGAARTQLMQSPACKYKDNVFQFKKQSRVQNLRDDNELLVQYTVASAGVTLAWKLGAVRIFLLGVDAYRTQSEYYADGTLHRSGMTRKHKKVDGDIVVEDRHERWIKEQRDLREWLTEKGLYLGPWPQSGVYNLSPQSQIDAWERVAPQEVLG